ncbi:hypothetical protein JXA05_04450 [Candidatus Peregrinibacteria bacterium]|nr:hypothetical protein [Candidatus Peregrinibacteria bacterium]
MAEEINETPPPEEAKGEPIAAEEPVKPESELDEVTTLHERTIAALSYVSFLAIVPFYLKKESKFCRFHGKQGLTVAIIFFSLNLFQVLGIIMDLVLILQFVIFLYMGFNTLAGKWKKLPFIYGWSCQLENALALKTKEEEEEEVALKPDQAKPEEQPKI